uniref:Uncharacterized protein n=1 Tax=viral metagenome TaxID=1070528 RepID=A0A6M3JAX4_9ZZZZ
MIVITTTIKGDEKAWGLFELNFQTPDNKGFHRYQIIQVLRGDKIAEYRYDMGAVSKFRGVKQLRIPSLWEHTVDELMDLADELRYVHNFDYKDYLRLDKVDVA